MTLWTIVPLRGLASSKSRLMGSLTDEERRALNEWLLRTVLDAIATSQGGLDRCVVVTPSEDAAALARTLGAKALEEPDGVGLNQALGLAAGFVTAQGATRLMVLSADLPYITATAIDRLLEAAAAGDGSGHWVVLVADHTLTGTNGIVLDVPSRLKFRFGVDSLPIHREEAIRIGAAVVVHRDPALAEDLDSPEDLARWQARIDGRPTPDDAAEGSEAVS